jgi:hypothetical protein
MAGVAVARGDRGAAIGGYRDAIGTFRELRLPLDEALVAIDMGHVFGPEDPATREAAGVARSLFEGLRSGPLLALLDAATGTGPALGATAAPTVVSTDAQAIEA